MTDFTHFKRDSGYNNLNGINKDMGLCITAPTDVLNKLVVIKIQCKIQPVSEGNHHNDLTP